MSTRIWLLLVCPALAFGYASGPPNGLTGAPGEGTCIQCHDSFGLNSGSGLLTISGPDEYEPGQTYPITVTLAHAGQSRWGFQMTPLDLGALLVTDFVNTQGSSTGGNSYVKHTTTGTQAGTADGPVSWTCDWIAPATDVGPVTFYAAGNAANGNFSNSGDYIYTASFTTEFPTGMAPVLVRGFALLDAYPNPFNPGTTLRYRLDVPGEARLEVYDLAGRLVDRLAQGWHGVGEYTARWAGLAQGGRPAAAGVYLARLELNGAAEVKRLLLVK
ncbi:MAG: choice-of-anchor V domain-containing protein [bacterium]|jgi:hypothetical protein|nr:choice-of-anchor V domain-containing protein [bacterium]